MLLGLRCLAGVHWVLHPVSGCSHRGCDCSLDDSVVVLFDSTCLFLRRRSCVFFLSSCSARGRLLLSLFWCCFCASSCGACGFPRRVLLQVTLRGFRYLSGSSCLSCSCGGAMLLVLRCLGFVAWFSTWCRALPAGGAAYPAAGYPWGLLPFLTPSA